MTMSVRRCGLSLVQQLQNYRRVRSGRRISCHVTLSRFQPNSGELILKLLEQIDDNVWLAKGEMVDFYGFPYPTRSVVVRLSSGDVWVWSPVKLRHELRAELARIGPIAHLVSPN